MTHAQADPTAAQKAPDRAPTKKPGRPSDFTPDIAHLICDRLIMGESLRQICQDPKMPARSSVFLWLREHREFADRYRLAKRLQIEDLCEQVLEIADDSTGDWVERIGRQGKRYRVVNWHNIRRSRLQIKARCWLISKLMPKKYGLATQRTRGDNGLFGL